MAGKWLRTSLKFGKNTIYFRINPQLNLFITQPFGIRTLAMESGVP